MNAKQQLKSPSPLPWTAQLKATKGPYKGVVYKLVAGKVTIGRSSENDIALVNDKKVSRKQALLMLEKEGHYVIKDLSKRASLKVNNIIKLKANLQDGDLIQCGTTVLQFEQTAQLPTVPKPHIAQQPAQALSPKPPALGVVPPPPISPAPAPLPATPSNMANPLPTDHSAEPALSLMDNIALQQDIPSPFPHSIGSPPESLNKKAGLKNKKKLKFRIILIALALISAYLFFSDSETQEEKADKLRTQMEKEKHLQTLQELEQTETEKRKKNKLMSYKHAQFAYIKGIRDYRKGVYSRAVESFRACKTIYPQHELCGAYLEKAQVKSQQIIQAWMIAGKAHREKRRFAPCMSSFKNVMTAIRDKSNLTYKEAYENYKICQLQYEDRY